MAERSRDWFAQAERDLRHAGNACRDADFEWACFAAQQSAEKAVKGYTSVRGWKAGDRASASCCAACLKPSQRPKT